MSYSVIVLNRYDKLYSLDCIKQYRCKIRTITQRLIKIFKFLFERSLKGVSAYRYNKCSSKRKEIHYYDEIQYKIDWNTSLC